MNIFKGKLYNFSENVFNDLFKLCFQTTTTTTTKIYLKSSIQTSSIDYRNYYDMYKYNRYDYTNRSVIITNG